jgi:hypothetical protein
MKLVLKNNTLTLPAEIVSEYHLGTEINVDLLKEGVLIRANKTPRTGWFNSFSNYSQEQIDGLDIVNESDETDWTW